MVTYSPRPIPPNLRCSPELNDLTSPSCTIVAAAVVQAILPITWNDAFLVVEIKQPFDPPAQHSASARDLHEGTQEFSIGGDASYSVRWHHISAVTAHAKTIKVRSNSPSLFVILQLHDVRSNVTREALDGSLRIVSQDALLQIAADPHVTTSYTVSMESENHSSARRAPVEVDRGKRVKIGEKESIRVGGDPPLAQIRHLRLQREGVVTVRGTSFGESPDLEVLTLDRKVVGRATATKSTLRFRKTLPAGEYVLRIAPTGAEFSTVTLLVSVATHDAGFVKRK